MSNSEKKRPVRVYMDGCFDLVHYGHANAIREAKKLGDSLVVGVHNDAEVIQHKGPPVYSEQERYQLIRAIKWVDEVSENAPYLLTMDTLTKDFQCDFVAHGDDKSISQETGLNTYQIAIDAGRYQEFKRTRGISTTDIVGRMLLMTKTHHGRSNESPDLSQYREDPKGPKTGICRFAGSTKKIMEFSSGVEPKPGDKIVYTSGSFDLLHSGHISFLEKVAKEGDYVIVGCHNDEVVNWYKGRNFPIMNIHERVLALLSCRYVSEVFIGAPYTLTPEIMDHFKIDLVVHGKSKIFYDHEGNDPFMIAKELDKFKVIDSGSQRTTSSVVERIIINRLEFEKRNEEKRKRDTGGAADPFRLENLDNFGDIKLSE